MGPRDGATQKRGMDMGSRNVRIGSVVLALVVMLAGGCAGTGARTTTPLPPAKMLQAADLGSLAGEWQGTLRGTGTTGPASAGRTANLRVTIASDGSFTSNIDGMPGTGKGRIEGGKIIFEGSAARGTATLHEGDGRRILAGQGTWVGFTGNSEFEVTKR
jgi:hypothetical protein